MKLCQVLAVEKTVKGRVYADVSELHKRGQKAVLFNGFSKRYTPQDDDGEQLPPESLKVQASAEDALTTLASTLTELFDIVATKDTANCSAKADVVVDGVTVLPSVPATLLLFLEKQLTDIQTFVEALPVLDPADTWSYDDASKCYRSATVKTHRTKKITKPIVLYPATPEHPAQTNIVTEDVLAGHWEMTKFSSALSETRKAELRSRVSSLIKAVKQARELANTTDSPPIFIGDAIFKHLFR